MRVYLVLALILSFLSVPANAVEPFIAQWHQTEVRFSAPEYSDVLGPQSDDWKWITVVRCAPVVSDSAGGPVTSSLVVILQEVDPGTDPEQFFLFLLGQVQSGMGFSILDAATQVHFPVSLSGAMQTIGVYTDGSGIEHTVLLTTAVVGTAGVQVICDAISDTFPLIADDIGFFLASVSIVSGSP